VEKRTYSSSVCGRRTFFAVGFLVDGKEQSRLRPMAIEHCIWLHVGSGSYDCQIWKLQWSWKLVDTSLESPWWV